MLISNNMLRRIEYQKWIRLNEFKIAIIIIKRIKLIIHILLWDNVSYRNRKVNISKSFYFWISSNFLIHILNARDNKFKRSSSNSGVGFVKSISLIECPLEFYVESNGIFHPFLLDFCLCRVVSNVFFFENIIKFTV
jgi:hypothetical protein